MQGVEHLLTLAAGPAGAKQRDFIFNEWFKEMALIGPFNTGKSTALVDWLIVSGLQYPGSNLVLTRAKLSDLRRTTMVKYLSRAGKVIAEDFNKNEATIEFPEINGLRSRLYMFGLDRSDLVEVLKSFEIFRAAVEESDEVPPEALDLLLGRARQKVQHVSKTNRDYVGELAQVWGTTPGRVQSVLGFSDADLDEMMYGATQLKHVFNPEGNNAVWQRVVGVPYPDPDEMSEEWTAKHVGVRRFEIGPKQVPHNYMFLPGDVVTLPDGTEARVAAQMSGLPKMVELIDGRIVPREDLGFVGHRAAIFIWPHENESRNVQSDQSFLYMQDPKIRDQYFSAKIDTKQGLLFPMFRRDMHVVASPKKVPNHLRGLGGVDHGLRHPTAALWGVETLRPRNGLLILKEYTVSGLSATENAYAILGMAQRDISTVWMGDPSMQRVEATSMRTVVEDYYDAGLPLVMADNSIEDTLNAVRDMLTPRFDARMGEEVVKLFVSSECEQLIQALERATYRDLQHRRDSWIVDVIDSLRYMVNGMAYMEAAPVESIQHGRPLLWG